MLECPRTTGGLPSREVDGTLPTGGPAETECESLPGPCQIAPCADTICRASRGVQTLVVERHGLPAGGVMSDRRHRRLTATKGPRNPAVWLPGCLRLVLVHFGDVDCKIPLAANFATPSQFPPAPRYQLRHSAPLTIRARASSLASARKAAVRGSAGPGTQLCCSWRRGGVGRLPFIEVASLRVSS
jgi:hypothetical protein